MEEAGTRSTHFGAPSSYRIPQTSQNRQTDILINCLTFKREFIMHNASMIEKNKTSSIAFTRERTCRAFLGWAEEGLLQCEDCRLVSS
jgi:hypothetical protein